MASANQRAARSRAPEPHGLDRVLERNAYFRDRHHAALRVTGFALGVTALALLAVVALALRPAPPPAYFATTADGRLVPLVPVSEPMMTPAQLTQWAAEVVVAAHSYSFADWRERLAALRGPLEDRAFEDFLAAVTASRNLDAVTEKKLVVSAVAAAPVITARGVLDGRYTWQVEVPADVTYQSASEQVRQRVIAVMRIRRVPVTEFPRGVQVTQLVIRPR